MPSGERLPGVLWPWAGSRRMSMALRRQLGDSGGEGRDFILYIGKRGSLHMYLPTFILVRF